MSALHDRLDAAIEMRRPWDVVDLLCGVAEPELRSLHVHCGNVRAAWRGVPAAGEPSAWPRWPPRQVRAPLPG